MTPFVLVIFGATGDLTQRKLMPALYDLARDSKLPEKMYIVGIGRRDLTSGQFQEMMEEAVIKKLGKHFQSSIWKKLCANVSYVQGQFEDARLYDGIITQLKRIDDEIQACVPRFFYLATPPAHYETILMHLQESKLSEGCLPTSLLRELKKEGRGFAGYTRVFIEKPFGKDLETAQMLEQRLSSIFDEQQIYRIDHYLGKETVQNILAFRFANGMFEPTWNSRFIDHVQITLAEDQAVGMRGAFYEGVGALRDVVQNHMLQMLALIAMEQPRAFDAEDIRNARAKVLQAVRCIEPKEAGKFAVRGQYEGYRGEKNVDSKSMTETFVALKLFIDTPRWKDVPFYIRTGKALKEKFTHISLHFKKPVCADDPTAASGQVCFFNPDLVHRNVLSIDIEPSEGIHLRLMAKKPGFGMDLAPVPMAFTYNHAFGDSRHPEAYERLLLDAIRGDQTLFARTDDIEASWDVVTKILQGWGDKNPSLHAYEQGSWGPDAARELIERDGRHWFMEET